MNNLKSRNNQYTYLILKTKRFYRQPLVQVSTNLILTFLFVSLLSVFAIKPTLITATKLRKELQEKKKINLALEQKITALNQAQGTYNQVIQDIKLVDQVLPSQVNFITAAQRINYLSFKHNLSLVNASFNGFDLLSSNEASLSAETKSLNFKISVHGLYSNIKDFIKDLETIDRLITINSLNFNPGSSLKGGMEVSLNGMLYWL